MAPCGARGTVLYVVSGACHDRVMVSGSSGGLTVSLSSVPTSFVLASLWVLHVDCSTRSQPRGDVGVLTIAGERPVAPHDVLGRGQEMRGDGLALARAAGLVAASPSAGGVTGDKSAASCSIASRTYEAARRSADTVGVVVLARRERGRRSRAVRECACLRGLPTARGGSCSRKRPGGSTTTTSALSTSCWA